METEPPNIPEGVETSPLLCHERGEQAVKVIMVTRMAVPAVMMQGIGSWLFGGPWKSVLGSDRSS